MNFWCRAVLFAFGLLTAIPAWAELLRVATWNVELSRRGPGLMLRDIEARDPLVMQVVATIAKADPDVLLLTGFDHDHDLVALRALEGVLAQAGAPYPHIFALRPNSGLATGLDLNGNGRVGDPADAQGYGRFAGAGGMAILSRLPVLNEQTRDFSGFLWRDLPGAVLPQVNGQPFPSAQAQVVQRLSSTGHWDVALALPGGGALHLLAFAATPPLFDGAEDRNGLRNAAEIGFWPAYLDGALPWPAPAEPFVIAGLANLDPDDGDGRREVMRALLAHPLVQDPQPVGAPAAQIGPNAAHRGNPALDTADWTTGWQGAGPGNLRVDYVLPSRGLGIRGAGLVWPEQPPAAPPAAAPPAPGKARPTRHALVWVDVEATAPP